MNLLDRLRQIARRSPLARSAYRKLKALQPDYVRRLRAETAYYEKVEKVHDLPPIFHYWSNRHLRPMVESLGLSSLNDVFITSFLNACKHFPPPRRFVSIGAGNCDFEIRIAKALHDAGASDFTIECLELNSAMLERGKDLAAFEGVSHLLHFTACDFNIWRPDTTYHGAMANQSLHHVLRLEHLFTELRKCLANGARFAVNDIIGRNGHMRWPEALAIVHEFWKEMPDSYRYNLLLRRHEVLYDNWDCSLEGFEGIRAQDILPLLLRNFSFELFLGYGNIIDPFIDRAFGHHLSAENEWDRNFIDRIHVRDELEMRSGRLKPCHMVAILTTTAMSACRFRDGLSPVFSVRTVN